MGTFLALTLVVSLVFWVPMIRSDEGIAGLAALVTGLMWAPGLAAMATHFLFRRTLRGLGWGLGRRPWRHWSAGYLLPLGYALATYALLWLSPWAGFDPESLDRLAARWYLLIPGTIQSCLLGLGEEIGWRGFLVPRLAQVLDFDHTSLTSGLVWSLWHYPVILFAGYDSGAPPLYSLAAFTVMATGISYAFAWLTLRSRSVWPAALMHGSHNLWIQGFFDRATLDTGPTEYWTGEFGAGLAAAGVVVALIVRRFADGSGDAKP